jgi:DNA-binding CsgD family transcriptional regulator
VNRGSPLHAADEAFSPERVPHIAEELSAAGIVDRAIAYYEAAGDIALSGEQYPDAASHYRRAIALERQSCKPRAVLFRKLAQTLHIAGAPQEAASVIECMLELHPDSSDLALLGSMYWANAQVEQGVAQALKSVDSVGDSTARFENLTHIASLNLEIGEVERAVALLQRAQELGAGTSAPLRARFLDTLGRTKIGSGLVEVGLADLRQAVQLIDADAGDLYYSICGNYADTAVLIGDYAEAKSVWKRVYTQAQTARMGWHIPDAALNYAGCTFALGNLGEALEYVERALECDLSSPTVRIRAAATGIPLAIALEREDLLERCADESLIEIALRSKEASRIGAIGAAFGRLYETRGHIDRCRDLLARSVALLRSADYAYGMLALAREHGDAQTGARARALLAAAAALRNDKHSQAFLHYTQGRDGAPAAAAIFAELHLPYWQARSLEKAGKDREALAIYREIGDRFDSRRLESIFERRKTRANEASGLTPRQMEIAHLVASGSSNKEIAAALAISEKTVENHLQVIYARLGISSRSKLIHVILNAPPAEAADR